MLNKRLSYFTIVLIVLFSMTLSGCSITFQKGRLSDFEKIKSLNNENEALNARLEKLQQQKEDEIAGLEKTQKLLEEKLQKEIGDKDVRVEMAERGLSIVFLAEVLFDSGKAEIRSEALGILDKIVAVLKENIGTRNIGIEGHTDNEPIKHSGWKSNWELSTSRATSVLHYLVDQKGVSPEKVAAIGYGEYRPVDTNQTAAGRRQNRRVEIVILPSNMEKIQADIDKISEEKRKIQKELNKYKK